MKTRNILFIASLGFATLFTASCMDGDWDEPDLTNPPYGNNTIQEGTLTTISALRTEYQSAINNSSYKEITKDVQIKVVVVGNDIGGNLYKQIAVQDETGALIIGINATGLYPYMPVGQELLINLKGLVVGGYGQQAQIGSEYNGGIGRMDDETWKQHVRLLGQAPEKIDTLDFNAELDKDIHSGYLVKLSNVTIDGADGITVLAPEDGSIALTSNCANRNIKGLPQSVGDIVLRTSIYSKFSNKVIPSGQTDIYGIATRYRNTWQILMRSESDLVEKETNE